MDASREEQRVELIKRGKELEAKRRAGTHVYHPQLGEVPIEKARSMCDSGRASIGDFLGDPETGVVKFGDATAAPSTQPMAPQPPK